MQMECFSSPCIIEGARKHLFFVSNLSFEYESVIKLCLNSGYCSLNIVVFMFQSNAALNCSNSISGTPSTSYKKLLSVMPQGLAEANPRLLFNFLPLSVYMYINPLFPFPVYLVENNPLILLCHIIVKGWIQPVLFSFF